MREANVCIQDKRIRLIVLVSPLLVAVSECLTFCSKGVLNLHHFLAMSSEQSSCLLLHAFLEEVNFLGLLLQVLHILVILSLQLLYNSGIV